MGLQPPWGGSIKLEYQKYEYMDLITTSLYDTYNIDITEIYK